MPVHYLREPHPSGKEPGGRKGSNGRSGRRCCFLGTKVRRPIQEGPKREVRPGGAAKSQSGPINKKPCQENKKNELKVMPCLPGLVWGLQIPPLRCACAGGWEDDRMLGETRNPEWSCLTARLPFSHETY